MSMISTHPLEKWLKPDRTWTKSDVRSWLRCRNRGQIDEELADRLCLTYARIQLELIHPDVTP